MKYNPQIHHRRSIRLKGYDYSQAGAYFITICCRNMESMFGEVINSEMKFNEYGAIAYHEWIKLPQRFPNFELDVFQIMPNHMHAIIVLSPMVVSSHPAANVGVSLADAQKEADAQKGVLAAGVNPACTVGDIVGAYKSLVANECLKIFKSKNEIMGKLWHRNYYEIIIRDERAYQNIAEYIINNPAKWNNDKFYSK